MSADNWAICPKCKITAEEKQKKLKLKAGAAYGKVEPEAYLQMLAEAEGPIVHKETLREDFYIGIDEDGDFSASYRGNCTECKFSFSFKHEADALAKGATL